MDVSLNMRFTFLLITIVVVDDVVVVVVEVVKLLLLLVQFVRITIYPWNCI